MRKIVIIILILNFCFILFINVNFTKAEFSSDPNNLRPLCNTFWKFDFYHGSLITKFIGFLPEVLISNGSAVLPCVDDEGWKGIVMYGDLVGKSGKGYICTLSETVPISIANIYQFNISSNVAVGKFFYYDESSAQNSWESFMTGAKVDIIHQDQNQPIIDSNQSIIPAAQIHQDSDGDSGPKFGCFISSVVHQSSP